MRVEQPTSVRVPPWTWAFVGACGAIPLVALGGLIPSVLGAVGATVCYAIAHDPEGKRSVPRRVVLCCVVSILAWASFGGLAWAVLRGAEAKPKRSQRSASSGGRFRVVRENGTVVYDSRLPSQPKRPLAEVGEGERDKICKLARRGADDLAEKRAQLSARTAEGGLTLRLDRDLEKLERKREEYLDYLCDRFRLTQEDLRNLLDERGGV